MEPPQANPEQQQHAPKPTDSSVEMPQGLRGSNTAPESLAHTNQPAVALMTSIQSEEVPITDVSTSNAHVDTLHRVTVQQTQGKDK